MVQTLWKSFYRLEVPVTWCPAEPPETVDFPTRVEKLDECGASSEERSQGLWMSVSGTKSARLLRVPLGKREDYQVFHKDLKNDVVLKRKGDDEIFALTRRDGDSIQVYARNGQRLLDKTLDPL